MGSKKMSGTCKQPYIVYSETCGRQKQVQGAGILSSHVPSLPYARYCKAASVQVDLPKPRAVLHLRRAGGMRVVLSACRRLQHIHTTGMLGGGGIQVHTS